MLFRNKEGKLVNINKLDYLTDKEYIDQILLIFNYALKNNNEDKSIQNKIINKLKEYNIPNIDNQNNE